MQKFPIKNVLERSQEGGWKIRQHVGDMDTSRCHEEVEDMVVFPEVCNLVDYLAQSPWKEMRGI